MNQTKLSLVLKTLATYLVWAIILPPTVFLLAAISLLPAKKRYKNRLFFYVSSLACRIITKAMLIPINISGKVPHGKFVIVINHASNLDSFFVDALMGGEPRLWMAKDLVAHIPIVGFIFKRMHVLVNRDHGSGAARALVRAIKLAKRFGSQLILFPEGTRNHGKQLLSFNKGFVRAARALGRSVLPIAIEGTAHLFLKKSPLIWSHTGKIRLTVGNPMVSHADESEKDFAEQVERWFNKTLIGRGRKTV